jgi:hypothetical protein
VTTWPTEDGGIGRGELCGRPVEELLTVDEGVPKAVCHELDYDQQLQNIHGKN